SSDPFPIQAHPTIRARNVRPRKERPPYCADGCCMYLNRFQSTADRRYRGKYLQKHLPATSQQEELTNHTAPYIGVARRFSASRTCLLHWAPRQEAWNFQNRGQC